MPPPRTATRHNPRAPRATGVRAVTIAALLIAAGTCAPRAIAQTQSRTEPPSLPSQAIPQSHADAPIAQATAPSPQHDACTIRARTIHEWREGEVQHIVAMDSVEATFAGYTFAAAKVSLTLTPATTPLGTRTHIAATFEGVSDASSGQGVRYANVRVLPVRATLDGAVVPTLRADSLQHERIQEAVAPGADPTTPWAPIAPSTQPTFTCEADEDNADATTTGTRWNASLDARFAARMGAFSASPQPTRAAPEPRLARNGQVTLAAGHVTYDAQLNAPNPAENPPETPDAPRATPVVIASGGVSLISRERTGRTLQLSAQRCVVFLRAGTPAQALSFDIEAIEGVYLEGEVSASDGDSTVRAPKVYYDLREDKALMLDAVFSTYDEHRGVPLYVRAKEVRQVSRKEWRCEEALLTNSAFLDPELAIGATSITVQRRQREVRPEGTGLRDPLAGEAYTWIDARGVKLRATPTGLPLFYWSSFTGDPGELPIRDVRFENRSGSGSAVKVRWNASSLLGPNRPDGLSADLLTDYYFDRGIALGARASWEILRHQGAYFGYMLPRDTGEDLMKPGTTIGRDNDFRGIASLRDRFRLSESWTILGEASHISDEAFLDAFFEQSAESRQEFTNRINATRREANTLLALEAKATLLDFVPSEWQLQSRGYTVNKTPEVWYARHADDVFPNDEPGLLTYFSEYRAGRYAIVLDEVSARSRGFDSTFLSQRAFGIDPDQSIANSLRSLGYSEETITRLDTRHELVASLHAGPVRVAPFVVARATAYDMNFTGFSSRPTGNDSVRAWSALGLRTSTTLSRVFDNVDSQLLDIHRLRHTITPNATLWLAGTNVEAKDIPTYDANVDALADGAAVRLGLAQSLQTKRGGIGNWFDSDLLTLNTDVVLATKQTDARTPIGRFFDSRPEYSALGNFATADLAYRLTDATTLAASTIYDLDTHQQDFTSAGIMLNHAPGFSTLLDVRYANAQNSTIVGMWGSYDLSDKYSFVLAPSYDAAEGRFQSLFLQCTRRFAAFQLSVGVSYNDITSETSIGFVLQPFGVGRVGGVDLSGNQFSGTYGEPGAW